MTPLFSRTITAMAQKVKQHRSGACTIKERLLVASKTDIERQFVDLVSVLFRPIQHLGTIREQSEHRKKLSSEWPTALRDKKLQMMMKMKTEAKVAIVTALA